MAKEFLWRKNDNFDTIHKKLLKLNNKIILGKNKEEFFIYSVGNIKKLETNTLPIWQFVVVYGAVNSTLYQTKKYHFIIPRKNDNYKKDLKFKSQNDHNHPFISYE